MAKSKAAVGVQEDVKKGKADNIPFIYCPRCAGRVIYYRKRTDDYMCRRCGIIFRKDQIDCCS